MKLKAEWDLNSVAIGAIMATAVGSTVSMNESEIAQSLCKLPTSQSEAYVMIKDHLRLWGSCGGREDYNDEVAEAAQQLSKRWYI